MNFDSLFPFRRNFLDLNGQKYHYLNEGQGDPVVMVHGNPSWSFYYRNLVTQLSQQYQCIVPDHIGCGLSDKPSDADYDYTLYADMSGGPASPSQSSSASSERGDPGTGLLCTICIYIYIYIYVYT